MSRRRLSNFILQHFAVCLVVYDLRLLPRLARVWHHISKITRTSAFVVVVSFHILLLCAFVFCLHSPFACVSFSLMVIQSLSGSPLELSVCMGMELPSWQPGCQPQLRLLQSSGTYGETGGGEGGTSAAIILLLPHYNEINV